MYQRTHPMQMLPVLPFSPTRHSSPVSFTSQTLPLRLEDKSLIDKLFQEINKLQPSHFTANHLNGLFADRLENDAVCPEIFRGPYPHNNTALILYREPSGRTVAAVMDRRGR